MNVHDPRQWFVEKKLEQVIKPPYAPEMQVTPLSQYSDNVIRFDRSTVPFGSKDKAKIDLLAACLLAVGRKSGLHPERDARLLETLKQMAVCYIFRLDILPQRRVKVSSPSTAHRDIAQSRKFLTAVREAGLSCISELTPEICEKVLTLAAPGGKSRDLYIGVVRDLMIMSRCGLLIPPVGNYQFEFESSDEPHDTTAPKGKQALEEGETEALLALSIFYLNKASLIVDAIAIIREDPLSPSRLKSKLASELPVVADLQDWTLESVLTILLSIACANLIFFHLGLRPSELLSLQRGFVRILEDGDALDLARVSLRFLRTKGMPKPKLREIKVHPMMKRVSDALEALLDVTQPSSNYIFPKESSDEELGGRMLVHKMNKFSSVNGIPIPLSGYNWRKTTIELITRLVTNGLSIAASLMDHLSKNETAGYALSNPLLQDDLQTSIIGIWRDRGGSLFKTAMAGQPLGGRAGERITQLLSPHITSLDIGLTEKEFVDDMVSQQVYPIKVAPGVYCVKTQGSRGACSKSSLDMMPDTANCSAVCAFQLQMPEREHVVRENLQGIGQFLDGQASRMQKRYAVQQLLDQLEAWPELKPVLEAHLSDNRKIRRWFK